MIEKRTKRKKKENREGTRNVLSFCVFSRLNFIRFDLILLPGTHNRTRFPAKIQRWIVGAIGGEIGRFTCGWCGC